MPLAGGGVLIFGQADNYFWLAEVPDMAPGAWTTPTERLRGMTGDL